MATGVSHLQQRLRPWVTAKVGVALARILVAGYALSTFAFYAWVPGEVRARGVLKNALTDGEARALLAAVALGVTAALVLAGFLVARGAKRRDAEPEGPLVEASHVAFLASPLVLWPLYEETTDVSSGIVVAAAMTVAFVASAWSFVGRSRYAALLDALDHARLERVGPWLALAMGLAHGALMAPYAVANFRAHFTGWDLAIYSQVHWNITTTGVPWSSLYSDRIENHYATHFSPIYHLTSLIYRLHRSPETLLVLQTLAVNVGALPAYLLTKRVTGRASVGLFLAAGYLVTPAAHGLSLYEFHEIAFFAPLMLALAWAVEVEHKPGIWSLLALVLLIREDTPAYVLLYGVWLGLRPEKRATAAKVVVVALAYLLTVHGVIMPWLRAGAPYVFDDRFAGLVRAGKTGKPFIVETLSTNVGYVVSYVVTDPAKWRFVALLFVPVVLLPFASRTALLTLVPGLAFSLLSSFGAQYSIQFHYTAPILPFLYLTSAVGIARVARSTPRVAVVLGGTTLLASGLLSGKAGQSPLLNRGGLDAYARARASVYGAAAPRIHEAAASIPKGACVRATGNLLPAIAERYEAHITPWGKHCDWALIDYAEDARQAPSSNVQEWTFIVERLKSGLFGIRYLDSRVVLIGRGEPQGRNEELVERLEAALAATRDRGR